VYDGSGYFEPGDDFTDGFKKATEDEKKYGSYNTVRPGSVLVEIEQVSSHGRIK
jgi:hypothetical protein